MTPRGLSADRHPGKARPIGTATSTNAGINPLKLRLSGEVNEHLYRCGYDQAVRYFHKASPETPAPILR